MENQNIRQLIRQELPMILQHDREMREWVLTLTREQYADKFQTESRFDRILAELRQEREEQTRKWEEQNRKWEANQRELRELREEQNRKWEANQRELRELREEQNRKWEEQNRKWEANQQAINGLLHEIHVQGHRLDQSIGALGARWGIQTEASFRNALAGILEESFGVRVMNVTEFDAEGEVFRHPSQIELDVIIYDGMLILCEIKSSMSASDMYTFDRKVTFYEKHHEQQATRKMVISPIVSERACEIAAKLGIEIYSYANDVPGL